MKTRKDLTDKEMLGVEDRLYMEAMSEQDQAEQAAKEAQMRAVLAEKRSNEIKARLYDMVKLYYRDLDDLTKRLQDDYAGDKPFVHMEEDRLGLCAVLDRYDKLKRELENDPQAKHEAEVQETTDMITAEDLTEQAVYAANAPACCSDEQQAENMLGMLGANVVEPEIYHTEEEHDEVMGESEPDYKQELKASVDAEYDEFKETLCAQGTDEVFNHSFEVNAKTEFMLSITEDAEYEPWVYKGLYQEAGSVLANLYEEYVSNPKGSINSQADTEAFIKDYCEKYYSDLHEEFNEEVEAQNQEIVMGGM